MRDNEWTYREIPLGDLPPGRHSLRLVSLEDRNNTNIDGFYLSSGPFQPPSRRTEIEQAKRLVLAASYRYDNELSFEEFFPESEDLSYPSPP